MSDHSESAKCGLYSSGSRARPVDRNFSITTSNSNAWVSECNCCTFLLVCTMHLPVLFSAILAGCILGCIKCQDSDEEFSYEEDYLDDGVATPSGRIMGKFTSFYGVPSKAYLGIPYAKAPVGDLRFKRPVPIEPWTEVIAADSMPPACIQYSETNVPWYDSEEGQDEDCLYLNIWSQRIAPRRTKVPVMFWIYGGGFKVGSNRLWAANGQGLSQLGDVIVVAPNYRVGAMGFLNSGTEDAPGNVGIYDIIEALQWTRKNIAAFGGDPDKITIFGQGSGSVMVSLFLLSPMTKGLFHRAIMQSGSFLGNTEQDPNGYNLDLSESVAEAVGCASDNQTIQDNPKEVVDCLKDVDGMKLAMALSSISPTSTKSFIPQYGDDFLPKNPIEDFKAGKFHDVPLLIGSNRDEGAYMLSTQYPELFGNYGDKELLVDKSFGASILRKQFRHIPDTEAVVEQYLRDVDDFDEVRRQVYTAMGDYNITCPSVYFAEQFYNGNNTVQYYLFAERPRLSPWAPWMGVTHYDEVPYVFARPIEGYNFRTFNEFYNNELAMGYIMMNLWSKFAKDGNAMNHEWKNYSKHHHQYMLLQYNVKKKMRGPGPHLDNCNFLRKYFNL